MQLERMDSEAFDEVLARSSFRFIERVNRWFGGSRIVWEFVRAEAARLRARRPLRVLDIGSGSCDIPMDVCARAARQGIDVTFTCVEHNPQAVTRARERLDARPGLPIRVACEDIRRHRPAALYDAAVGSMVFHHLRDAEIPPLLGALREMVSGGILINDLERCWPNWLGAHILCLRECPDVRHDATLSVRRGFRLGELGALLGEVPGVRAEIRRRWPFRVAAVVRREEAEPGMEFP
ncbi:MAG: methyltransferase domain-containing protein [Lentisphaeria bacterium]|nr:methyltransferase domain-containing protein [Lentisphaeria bacterium]